jgi:hypothetical protein
MNVLLYNEARAEHSLLLFCYGSLTSRAGSLVSVCRATSQSSLRDKRLTKQPSSFPSFFFLPQTTKAIKRAHARPQRHYHHFVIEMMMLPYHACARFLANPRMYTNAYNNDVVLVRLIDD